MTTLDDLVRAVERDRTNPILAAMLTAELMELKDMTRSEADKAVQTVALGGSDATLIRQAAELLAGGTASRRWIVSTIYRRCRVPRGQRPVILIDRGTQYLVKAAHEPTGLDSYWGKVVIVAGATMLLTMWRDHHASILARRRELYRRRKAS